MSIRVSRRNAVKIAGASVIGATIGSTAASRHVEAASTTVYSNNEFGVPGNAVVAEYTDQYTQRIVKGWGTAFQADAGAYNFFHFPLPVPYIIDAHWVSVYTVSVFFKSDSGVNVTAVHLYDGATFMVGFDGNYSGDYSNSALYFGLTNPFQVHVGVGVSVKVQWSNPGMILFAGARVACPAIN